MATGILYIVSAASGTGKTSLNHALMKALPNLKFSVSYTTRPAREGEQDGVDYHFVSKEKFDELIAQDAFLEYANVFGHQYGTSIAAVEAETAKGHDIILEIDWQGAQNARKRMKNNVSIFILPPSRAVLEQRLTSRNQDNEDVIQKRLKVAGSEIAHCVEYDYLIVNEDFDRALDQLQSIVKAKRCSQEYQVEKWQSLIDELVSFNVEKEGK